MLDLSTFENFDNDWEKFAHEHGTLFQGLIVLNKCQTILEVGVATAETTKLLCQAGKVVGGKVYGYDCWAQHGLANQFSANCTLEKCEEKLKNAGFDNFELTKMDLSGPEFANLVKTKHPQVDFAFIDACHSYYGVSNDFWAVYPSLKPGGIVAFHDTLACDGCREFVIDLRTKFYDGTYDIVEFPYANGNHRTGVSILVKRSFAILQNQLPILDVCNLTNTNQEIYAKERNFYNNEVNRAAMRFKLS